MLNKFIVILLTCTLHSFAGSFLTNYSCDNINRVIGIINLKDIGITNLNIDMQIIYNNKRNNKTISDNDYNNLIEDIKFKSQAVAIKHVCNNLNTTLDSISIIKLNIEKEINNYIKELQQNRIQDNENNIAVQINSIFITSPNNTNKPQNTNRYNYY